VANLIKNQIQSNGHGGRRQGSGRKHGSRGAVQQKAIDIAGKVLAEIDDEKVWKSLLTCGDARVVFDVMRYLTDRCHGKPVQKIAGDRDQPVTMVLKTFPVEW
jgi:hypothetical protein